MVRVFQKAMSEMTFTISANVYGRLSLLESLIVSPTTLSKLLLAGTMLSGGTLMASAIAYVPGGLASAPGLGAVAGPGIVCAHAQLGNVTDPAAGAAGAQGCNDQTKIGNALKPPGAKTIINTEDNAKIGNAEKAAGIGGAQGGALGGRAIQYNVDSSADKVADANASPNSTLTLTAGATVGGPAPPIAKSNATQTVTILANKTAAAIWLATAGVDIPAGTPKPNNVGFAVGIVNDPLLFSLENPGQSSSLAFMLGPIMLTATDPGDAASMFIELDETMANSSPVLSFSMSIDSSTSSLAGVQFNFTDFNPLIGYADPATFVDSVLLPNLTFDSRTHELTGSKSLKLFSLNVPAGSPDFTVIYNTGALASADKTPEPASLPLFLTGGLLVAAGRWRGRRRALR
jgi:hypothetical protein